VAGEAVLITGASGLLGVNLALEACASGHRVTGVFNQHPLLIPGVEAVRADLTDSTAVWELVTRHQPAWIVHCAALTQLDWIEDHPAEAERTNVASTAYLAEAAERIGARLIYISTDSVFDGSRGGYVEDDHPAPVNVYGRTKLAGEAAVARIMGERATILRTNMFGFNVQKKSSLAEWVLETLEAAKRIEGFADVLFTPLFVNDLARLCLEVVAGSLGGLFHVGSADGISKYGFALEVADVFGLDKGLISPVSLSNSALRAPRPLNTTLNSTKFCRALKKPMPTVREGLQRFKVLRDEGFPARLHSFQERSL
jgi:dTDP-4-dehydrorhamnose reductase